MCKICIINQLKNYSKNNNIEAVKYNFVSFLRWNAIEKATAGDLTFYWSNSGVWEL